MKNTIIKTPFQDLQNIIHHEEEVLDAFPYPVKISFLPFRDHIKEMAQQTDRIDNSFTQFILDELEANPALLDHPNIETIEKHPKVLHHLMAGFFPPFFERKQYGYITAPFSSIPLFMSQHLQELMEKEDTEVNLNMKEEEVFSKMVSNACSLILQKYYGQSFEASFPTIFSIRNNSTQLEKHLKLNIVTDYIDVRSTRPLPSLSKEQIRELVQNPTSPQHWIELLPPDSFEFFGLLFVYFTDVNETEIVSRLKDKMLGKDPTHFLEDVEFVQQQVHSYFNDPDTSMGLKILDQSFARMILYLYRISISALEKDVFQFTPEKIAGSSYHKVWQSKKPLIIEDLSRLKQPTQVEQCLLQKGIRSLLLYPSVHQDPRLNQIVELYSPHPKAFNYQSLVKLKIILPLIEAGLNKKREELESSLASIVQDQFTNIDPSVYWKFKESAIRQLKEKEGPNGRPAVLEPILFKEVYPLYGQADIVSSSVNRNKAIQSDMIDNLLLTKKILKEVASHTQTHLLDYYSSKVDQLHKEIQKSFRPSDETHILDLLKNDIHPCLESLKQEIPTPKSEIINHYFKQLHPQLGVIYRARKDFEESVMMINHQLSQIIQQADHDMQEKLPHYFEKYQTDGVEYNIYVGQSILQNQTFSKYHLKNFRLWQLLTMCDVTRKVKELQKTLPAPLETAQLIFVYSDPLDIRFRMDEKHFDVDGAYNVRYEIIKKRIDKAVIHGTNERLTQSGKIAIVYLHEKNRTEYLEYLQYLLQQGLISSDIEELELGKLQGVEGLRALRISVK